MTAIEHGHAFDLIAARHSKLAPTAPPIRPALEAAAAAAVNSSALTKLPAFLAKLAASVSFCARRSCPLNGVIDGTKEPNPSAGSPS